MVVRGERILWTETTDVTIPGKFNWKIHEIIASLKYTIHYRQQLRILKKDFFCSKLQIKKYFMTVIFFFLLMYGDRLKYLKCNKQFRKDSIIKSVVVRFQER